MAFCLSVINTLIKYNNQPCLNKNKNTKDDEWLMIFINVEDVEKS